MQKNNKTIVSQIISGVLKFLAVFISILVIIIVIIPSLLSIFKGKDIPPVNDSKLQLQTINIPNEENAFYDLDKTRDLINLKNVPKGKQLVSDYLESDEWDQELVQGLLLDNELALQNFTDAATKGKFQLPYTADPSKISIDMPVTPLNNWRELSRLSGVRALWLAKNGQNKAALDEAFKSIIIGNAMENSQGTLITYLVGISIKDSGLDTLQKLISMIPKNDSVLSEYSSKLEGYQAKGNSAPFSIEYIVSKQSLDNLDQNYNNWSKIVINFLIKNKFYFKKNLTISYHFDFYNKLAEEAVKDCSELEKVLEPTLFQKNNLVKMYFTENVVGKYFGRISALALNNVLTKKCATENKLKETSLLINNQYLSFTDRGTGLKFNYPKTLESKYISENQWPPVITIIDAEQLNCPETPAESSLANIVISRQINNRVYCIKTFSEGAAGSIYTNYNYSTLWRQRVVNLDFILQYPRCDNYSDQQQEDCNKEREKFDLDSVVDNIFSSLD